MADEGFGGAPPSYDLRLEFIRATRNDARTTTNIGRVPTGWNGESKTMSKVYDIACLPGDGIGEEVVVEGLKVLDACQEVYGFQTKRDTLPYGADHYLKTGETMPDEAIDRVRDMNAVLLGAIGDPRIEVGKLEFAIIAGLRFKLDLYVNLRPIKLYDPRFCPLKDKGPKDVDMLICRENTEGAYSGIYGHLKKGTPDEVATQTMVFTRKGVERIIRFAFERAMERPRKKVTLIDKANALRSQDIWTRTFAEVASEYPSVETDHAYIDAACMWMVKNPEWFDVGVCPNLFGDIITDLGAMVQGGMGIAASGNIHPGQVSMFEPIHGSAPKYMGQNKANPIATIMAVSMMLDFLGETEAAKAIEGAVSGLMQDGQITSLSAGVHGTDELGNMIADRLRS